MEFGQLIHLIIQERLERRLGLAQGKGLGKGVVGHNGAVGQGGNGGMTAKGNIGFGISAFVDQNQTPFA